MVFRDPREQSRQKMEHSEFLLNGLILPCFERFLKLKTRLLA
jgi:hypothetical protein